MAVCSLATVHAQSAAPRIALVQEAGKDAGETMSSSLAFNTTNKTGDLIVVAVLAGTAGEAFTITDSNRNTYRKAVQYDVTVDGDTLGLFYAENVAGGANAVTVSATMQDNLRFVILEYSGVATANSLDATAAAQGTSTSPNNANSVTTANGDLLLGAVMTAAAANFSAGNGYITEASVPTEPGTRLMVEDQVQSTAGAASASASLSASDKWGAALAAFKAAGAAGSTGPSITSLSPTSGLVGTAVTITGTNFGSTQGTVTFNGTTATPTNWNATSIAVTVPSSATTGNVVVTVGGIASNGASFTVNTPAPNITGINPTSGLVGTAVTITGTNFGSTQGTSTVTFNGTKGTPANWNATSIAVAVPSGATTGNVVVTVSGIASNGVTFTVSTPAPNITNLNPTSGVVGTAVTITGTNFGSTQGTSTVTFNGTKATPANWNATSIAVTVPSGATTGNVIVTVSGIASNGVSFTVVPDTTAPAVKVTAPASNASVSGTITITAMASDPDSPVAFVQFQVDGSSTGGPVGAAPYSLSLDTTTLTNGNHTLTAFAQDPAGNQGTSAAVTVTVSNSSSTAMGPLKQSATNSHYFVDPAGKAVLLVGSHTWDDFQDMGTASPPPAFDFNGFLTFHSNRGQNFIRLWKKELPTLCGFGDGSNWFLTPWPFPRNGPGNASDGLPQFDLSQFYQPYFDRLRARVQAAQAQRIYVGVMLFADHDLTSYRCSQDGYPFSSGNNINGIADTGGNSSQTLSIPAITSIQDNYVKKVVDTVNDLPNVIYEISNEGNVATESWQTHMIDTVRNYEATKPFQHPIWLTALLSDDSFLYASTADVVSPLSRISPTNNQAKVIINDTDHSYTYTYLLSDGAAGHRAWVWENFTSGSMSIFMDPYLLTHLQAGRNNPGGTCTNGLCTGPPDTQWDQLRDNMGYTLTYAAKMDLVKMLPQGSLSSTGYCLAQTPAVGAEYLVYAPNGGSFSVNLSPTTRVLNVEWFSPSSGTVSAGGMVTGGSSTQSFTPPFSGDAVLYLVDAAGHN
jgi:hypothetical protein